MDFCPQNLREVFDSMDSLYEDRHQIYINYISFKILEEVIECVQYLHLNKNIIHGNLKPQNVLISDGSNDRFFKLCDFGFTDYLEVYSLSEESVVYMAPEVIHQNIRSEKSDIYSMGVIVNELFHSNNVLETKNL